MPGHPEHELTLNLLLAVASELEPDEQEQLFATRALIEELLALGPNPDPADLARWIENADQSG
jgi:hypothetical protein